MVRHSGIEEMGQRMRAEEIQIGGERMRFQGLTGPWWNRGPIQRHSSQMSQLDLFPMAKPVNPSFDPVMIRRDGDEESQEQPETEVSAAVPVELVERDRHDEADEENSQSPPCKGCADAGAAFDEVICPTNDRCELSAS